MNKLQLFIAGALLAVLVGAAVLLGGGGGEPPQQAEAAQRRAFSVLRSAPQAPPPGLIVKMEAAVAAGDFGLDYSLAQRVRTTIGEPAWVVPGRGFVCVMGSDPIVAGCNTTRETVRQGMSVVAILPAALTPSGKRYDLFGIAPDGVERVAISTAGGLRTSVPVVDNVYAFRSPRMIRARIVR